MIDGITIANYLTSLKYKIKTKTKGTVIVLVEGNRLDKMRELAKALNQFKAKIDPNMSGSSIGGIKVDTVKVYIKAAGKTGGLDVESAAISMLQDAIANAMAIANGPIDLQLKGKVVKGVVGVRKTAGTPKSDFHLVNSSNTPLCHISHKKGSTPKDFQQWGGITESKIAIHPEIEYFEKQVNALYPNGKMPNGESAYMKIKDTKLKFMSVYGVNFDNGGIDENKVDVLIQGNPGIKRLSGNKFELTSSGNIHYLPEAITGGFEPVLAVIYKGDRTQLGLRGARASIYPIGGRSFKQEIKNKS